MKKLYREKDGKQTKDHLGQGSINRLRQITNVLRKNKIIYGLTPTKLRHILEDLGPTFVKVGQIMSMRSDILPDKYCDELILLRTNVKPMPQAEVDDILKATYGEEIGKIFDSISDSPIGSASIAQVHKAILKDGSEVVLKIQRPNIKEIMAADIELMRKAARILGIFGDIDEYIDLELVIDAMWKVVQEEIDFIKEQQNIIHFSELNKDVKYIAFPKVYQNISTEGVLVMEYIDGINIGNLNLLKENGYETIDIGRKLAENFIKQILDDRYFHADPHHGNIMIRDGKIVWLDLGMVGAITVKECLTLKRIIRSILMEDIYELKSIILSLGHATEKVNHIRLYTDLDDMVSKYVNMELGNLNIGEVFSDALGIVRSHKIEVPASFAMLARSIMTIEGVLSELFPEISFIDIIFQHLSSSILEDFDLKKLVKKTAIATMNLNNKVIEIPSQIYDILKMTTKGQTKFNIEVNMSDENITKIEHLGNRFIITILAMASIIGTGLTSSNDLEPKIFGFSLLGWLLLFISVFLSGYLLLAIYYESRKSKRKRRLRKRFKDDN